MKYENDEIVKVGDEVELWNGTRGVVVLSIDTHEETDEFLLEDWKILEDGVLVKTIDGALFAFHDNAGEEFKKI